MIYTFFHINNNKTYNFNIIGFMFMKIMDPVYG